MYKPAAEDWHPCFDGGLVRLYRAESHLGVTGADDTLVERHYTAEEQGAMDADWEWLCGLSVVFREDLRARGFR